MNLWFRGLLLVAWVFLGSSALTPEECQPLVTPLSLADPKLIFGRANVLVGYTDSQAFDKILKLTDSSWFSISKSPSSPGEVVMNEENKINGKCYGSSVNVTIDGDTATASLSNITSVFHMLPSCEGCLVFSINSTTRELDKFLQPMNINITIEEEEINARSLYLMGRESTVKDEDLEHFKQQASCLGFSGEPDYQHDPKKDFCAEGEGFRVKFS